MSTLAHRPLVSAAHTLGLFGAALLSFLSTQGCSLEVPPLSSPEALVVEPPPLFEIEAPVAGLRYTEADDEDREAAGVQLPVRVRVNDVENGLALMDLEVLCQEADARQWVEIEEDERGERYARLTALTFPAGGAERFTVIARAAYELPTARAAITVVTR